MKIVDTQVYVTVLKELAQEGKEVQMQVAGSSMSPFLIDGRDSVTFKSPDRPLKAGDIVFYQRWSGQYVMHRICRVKPEGYYIVGDAQTQIEGPVPESQVFARITKVTRKGRQIGPGDFWWNFFEKIWIRMIPLRPTVMRLYGICYRIRERR